MKTGTIYIRLPKDLKDWITAEADRLGISVNALTIIILNEKRGKK